MQLVRCESEVASTAQVCDDLSHDTGAPTGHGERMLSVLAARLEFQSASLSSRNGTSMLMIE